MTASAASHGDSESDPLTAFKLVIVFVSAEVIFEEPGKDDQTEVLT